MLEKFVGGQRRPLSPLKIKLYCDGIQYYSRLYGFDFGILEALDISLGLGEEYIFLSRSSMERSLDTIKKIWKSEEMVRNIFKISEKKIREGLDICRRSVKEIDDLKFLEKFFDGFKMIAPAVHIFFIFDLFLSKVIKIEEVYPSRPTELQEMKIKILEMKKKGKSNEEIAEYLEREYGWISTYDFYQNPYKKENFLNIIKGVKEEEIKLRKDLIGEVVYYREFRTNAIKKAIFYVRKRLDKIAKKLGIDLRKLSLMLPEELIEAVKTGKVDKKVFERESGFVMHYIGGKLEMRVGREYAEKLLKEFFEKAKEKEVVRGLTANRGIVKGIAKVVLNENDLIKVEKGDILITQMTNPAYTIVMDKVRGIITDEGGISCHAAIISREFGIPCIVGTGSATRVFKDWDIVLLNANKGWAKKIDRIIVLDLFGSITEKTKEEIFEEAFEEIFGKENLKLVREYDYKIEKAIGDICREKGLRYEIEFKKWVDKVLELIIKYSRRFFEVYRKLWMSSYLVLCSNAPWKETFSKVIEEFEKEGVKFDMIVCPENIKEKREKGDNKEWIYEKLREKIDKMNFKILEIYDDEFLDDAKRVFGTRAIYSLKFSF